MPQTGYTPLELYYSTTPSAAPSAGDLVNGELAINITDGKLYYKDNTGSVQIIASKAAATGSVTAVSVASANGFSGSSSGGSTPALTLGTTITGLLKGNGSAISAATSGTDYAPATTGTSILYGDGSGGFSNVVVGSGLSFSGGTLTSTGSGGSVTTVSVSSANGFSGTVTDPSTTPSISLSTSVSGIIYGNSGALNAVTVGTGLSFIGGTLSASGGGGDVYGPASSTDNAIVRFDSTTGKVIQNSLATISDTGDITATSFTGSVSPSNLSGVVTYDKGGTGQSSWTKGQLLYASANNVLAKLNIGTTNQVLVTSSGGIPSWANASTIAVTSVGAGNGMNFTTITGTGNVTLGTPSTCTASTSNSVTSTSHTHTVTVLNQMTAQPTIASSTTPLAFTGIPSNAKRITVMIDDVSLSGSDSLIIQLGTSAGFVTSGYTGCTGVAGGTNSINWSSGILCNIAANSTDSCYGSVTITLLGSNTWASQGVVSTTVSNPRPCAGGGTVSLSGTLTQVRILPSGTNSFDAGGIVNVMYE